MMNVANRIADSSRCVTWLGAVAGVEPKSHPCDTGDESSDVLRVRRFHTAPLVARVELLNGDGGLCRCRGVVNCRFVICHVYHPLGCSRIGQEIGRETSLLCNHLAAEQYRRVDIELCVVIAMRPPRLEKREGHHRRLGLPVVPEPCLGSTTHIRVQCGHAGERDDKH